MVEWIRSNSLWLSDNHSTIIIIHELLLIIYDYLKNYELSQVIIWIKIENFGETGCKIDAIYLDIQ